VNSKGGPSPGNEWDNGRGPSLTAGFSKGNEMTTLKPHMLERAKDYSEILDANVMLYDTQPSGAIPEDLCNVAQLIELLEMVGEDAIRQAIQDDMDRETRETAIDLRRHFA